MKASSISVNISHLLLDKENPRFQKDTSDELDIVNYLFEVEDLDGVIKSIQRVGFNEIGERIVVEKLSDRAYVVLEGNRRVAALKVLHGFYEDYKDKFDFDSVYLRNTERIQVDLSTRAEATQFLSMRHIEGIRKWSAESKRRFYGIQYMERKRPLNDVFSMSPESGAEISKYIREYVLLLFCKNLITDRAITKPSLIYERLYARLKDYRIVNPIELPDNYHGDALVKYTNTHFNDEESEYFITSLLKLIVPLTGESAKINSRNINRSNDLKMYLQGNLKDFDSDFQTLINRLFTRLSITNKSINLVNKEVIEGQPNIKFKDIFTIPDTSMQVSLMKVGESRNLEFEFDSACDLSVGEYEIKYNGFSEKFRVQPKIEPKIIFSDSLKELSIKNSYPLSNLISVSDIFGKTITLPNPSIIIECIPDCIKENRLVLESPEEHSLKVKYLNSEYSSFKVEKIYQFTPKPNIVNVKTPVKTTYKENYFTGKFIELRFDSTPVSSELVNQMNHVYSMGYYCLFAAGLRTVVETLMFEVSIGLGKPRVQGCKFFTNLANQPFVFNSYMESLSSIIKNNLHYVNELAIANKINPENLKNYFATLDESIFRKIKGVLNLGSHGATTVIDKDLIVSIRNSINAIIELLNLIRITYL